MSPVVALREDRFSISMMFRITEPAGARPSACP
jgi:hypothetical protein